MYAYWPSHFSFVVVAAARHPLSVGDFHCPLCHVNELKWIRQTGGRRRQRARAGDGLDRVRDRRGRGIGLGKQQLRSRSVSSRCIILAPVPRLSLVPVLVRCPSSRFSSCRKNNRNSSSPHEERRRKEEEDQERTNAVTSLMCCQCYVLREFFNAFSRSAGRKGKQKQKWEDPLCEG